MKTQGIKISDKINNYSVKLMDILSEINNPNLFTWSFLYYYGTGDLEDISIVDFEDEIRKSPNGLLCTWDELIARINQFNDIYSIIIVGCKNKETIKRLDDDQKMYETFDYYLEFFDGGFWEVFSKDEAFIDRLANKFKDTKFLKTDFQNEWLLKDKKTEDTQK